MKKLYKTITAGIFTLSFIGVSAQTVHEVTVSNFSFEPASITIEVGDVVIWNSLEGFHNVGTAAFPDNPNSFGNELAVAPWVYEFTFTEVGTNQYQCDQHPGPMQGTVIVEDNSLSTSGSIAEPSFSVYPNPVTDVLKWKWKGNKVPEKAYFRLYDLTGQVAAEFSMKGSDRYDLRQLRAGIYHYQIDMGEGAYHTGKLVIQRR